MHPRLDAENRRLVRADLDRRVERRARGAVDRAFVATRVRQPSLQRNNVLATASGRVGRRDGKERHGESTGHKAMHSAHVSALRLAKPHIGDGRSMFHKPGAIPMQSERLGR